MGAVDIVETGGLILYSGPESAPTFPPGSYNVVNAFTGQANTITDVPEPAAWALMLLGLGGLGAPLRMSRRKSGAAASARRLAKDPSPPR